MCSVHDLSAATSQTLRRLYGRAGQWQMCMHGACDAMQARVMSCHVQCVYAAAQASLRASTAQLMPCRLQQQYMNSTLNPTTNKTTETKQQARIQHTTVQRNQRSVDHPPQPTPSPVQRYAYQVLNSPTSETHAAARALAECSEPRFRTSAHLAWLAPGG